MPPSPPQKRPRLKKKTTNPAAAEKGSTTKCASVAESVSPEDLIFAGVTWDQPLSEADHKAKDPGFVAWLEDESAWKWHICYSEKDGFKLMGSERDDGSVFLWKYCCATEAMSMAAERERA